MNFVLKAMIQIKKIDLGFENKLNNKQNPHYPIMDSHTNFPINKYYRQQLSNTFSKIDEDTFNLRIETSHSIVLDVKIDATHINQIMKLSWSPLNTNRSKKYYIKHSHDSSNNNSILYLHQYVMQLNNIHPPTATTNNTGDDHSESSVDSFTVDSSRATEYSQSEHTVDTSSNRATEYSQSEHTVDSHGATENPVPSGTGFSVDHINRDPLDNRLQNLRWATQSEQNQNTDKRKRQCTARELPTGIQQADIPKWVNYNVETIVQSSGQSYNRCYFRIEKHPRLSKWTSTKSVEVTPQEKLAQTYHYMMKMGKSFESIPEYIQKIIEKKNFDDDTLMEENGFTLKRSMIPKYVNFVKETEKRGCKFEIAIPGTKRVSTKGAKSITLEEKFNEMMMKLN